MWVCRLAFSSVPPSYIIFAQMSFKRVLKVTTWMCRIPQTALYCMLVLLLSEKTMLNIKLIFWDLYVHYRCFCEFCRACAAIRLCIHWDTLPVIINALNQCCSRRLKLRQNVCRLPFFTDANLWKLNENYVAFLSSYDNYCKYTDNFVNK